MTRCGQVCRMPSPRCSERLPPVARRLTPDACHDTRRRGSRRTLAARPRSTGGDDVTTGGAVLTNVEGTYGKAAAAAEPSASRPDIPGYGVPEGDEGVLPWSHVVARLAEARNYWVATVGANGRPHAVPVWGIW